MKDTAGNEIQTINPHCDCGLTCGCEKCNPMFKQSKVKIKINKKDDGFGGIKNLLSWDKNITFKKY